MSTNPNKCTDCLETGQEHQDCPKCNGRGYTETTEKVVVVRECPVPNCVKGLYSPACRECKGDGCEKCAGTGMALWDGTRGPDDKQPKSDTHVKGHTHFFTKCKVCKGTNKVKKAKSFPNRITCKVCNGLKKVPTHSGLPCPACGGTTNRECGNQIEIPEGLILS